ncbi:MAG: DUF2177 family protein [Reichenbachiella sp.]|uniref:DUF2177 family protein n=1 Tax=Reichenbachiella sp. TaxID=2184521 RepID=UPI003263A09C
MKRIALSLIAAFLTMFVLGGLWNALIMENFYLSHSPSIIRPPEAFNLPVIALGYFVLTAIMTLIVVQNFNENPKFIGGFMFGATFGVAATLPLYLILWGRWDFSMSYVLVDSIWHLFEEGIGAVVLCKVFYGTKMKKEVLTS